MDRKQWGRLWIIVRMLVSKGKVGLAFKAVWIQFKVELLVASKRRHNRRQEKLLRQSISVNTDIQVELGKFDLDYI